MWAFIRNTGKAVKGYKEPKKTSSLLVFCTRLDWGKRDWYILERKRCFDKNIIFVRDGEGKKDRTTILSENLKKLLLTGKVNTLFHLVVNCV